MAETAALLLYLIGFLAVFAFTVDDPRIRDETTALGVIALLWPLVALLAIVRNLAGRRRG